MPKTLSLKHTFHRSATLVFKTTSLKKYPPLILSINFMSENKVIISLNCRRTITFRTKFPQDRHLCLRRFHEVMLDHFLPTHMGIEV